MKAFMDKKYFLTVAIVGLIGAIFFGMFIFGKAFFLFFSIELKQNEKFIGILPIMAGVTGCLWQGHRFDKVAKNVHGFPRTFIYPPFIYYTGVLAGTAVNLLVNGLFDTHPMRYVTAPLIVLTIYGVPASLVIGVLCFLAWKIIGKIQTT